MVTHKTFVVILASTFLACGEEFDAGVVSTPDVSRDDAAQALDSGGGLADTRKPRYETDSGKPCPTRRGTRDEHLGDLCLFGSLPVPAYEPRSKLTAQRA